MDKMMQLGRVKKIALENVGPISDKLGAGGGSLWYSAANTLVAAMKTYVDGKPVRDRRVGELMELIPKGLDSRLPGGGGGSTAPRTHTLRTRAGYSCRGPHETAGIPRDAKRAEEHRTCRPMQHGRSREPSRGKGRPAPVKGFRFPTGPP